MEKSERMPKKERKYFRFINSLITNTKEKQIVWEYLDVNHKLLQKLGLDENDFHRDDSFYVQYKDSYFVLLSTTEVTNPNDYGFDLSSGKIVFSETDGIKLFIIPSTFRDITIISTFKDDTYSQSLIRLRNLIKKDFPSADDIMEQFMSDTFQNS